MNQTKPPSPLFVGLHHVALAALQPHAAGQFYREAAGCVPWPALHRLGLPPDAVLLRGPNAGLVVLPADPQQATRRRPVNEAGIAHICLQTTDIGQVIDRFVQQRASLHSAPIDLGTGFLYCYARDPEANVIEVECVAPVWDDARPWLAHANIVTTDLPRLTAFYTALLGTEAVRSPRLRDDPRLDTIADLPGVALRAAWLQAGNTQIELMQYLQPATPAETDRRVPGAAGYAHLAFEVRDLGASCAHLLHCGGALVADPGPCDWQVRALDPDGNALLFLDLQHPDLAELRLEALADPRITHRFAAARAALT